ncbi:NfeD family protein [Hydromonas duriensis]|uniref:Membrane protein implicated in regulation of membrane protease activity n=1 Tax=Hydromonas duriensis TaxID=1527608 RepID=A0A4R6YA97_9BURK|nr:NfeD family protein [Hydromonas duriensis]TDR32397.1 membrane protein implicated in regulation of membrane protease activity [Hydromonas duriensis]
MSTYSWLVIATVLLVIEITTGTFYLLMLAIAAVCAWFGYLLGASFLSQSLIFLVASAILVSLVYRYRTQKLRQAVPNLADQLDTGEIVMVNKWHNGVGDTQYRGAHWQVVLETPIEHPTTGQYRIVRLDGTRLLVKPL